MEYVPYRTEILFTNVSEPAAILKKYIPEFKRFGMV